MRDLTIYAPRDSNLAGIGRFYRDILGAHVLMSDNDNTKDNNKDHHQCIVTVGPKQTLTFVPHPDSQQTVRHDDLRDEQFESPAGFPAHLSNYGPHVSMYVADLASTLERADKLGVTYVNPRFKRRAFTLGEARAQCMFRCLDIVDPAHSEQGVILKLEHEVRSVVQTNGSLYKSCPLMRYPTLLLQHLVKYYTVTVVSIC
jgi:catechol 2,3-dioxygenase-like lactoylglutathione lyase family enzyme